MVHLNKGKNRVLNEDSSVDELDRKKLEWLMPYDMWLYDYASQLLNAKWNFYKNGVIEMPDRPPFPRFAITNPLLYQPLTSPTPHLTNSHPRAALPNSSDIFRLTCISTRYILTCEKGPFGNAFYYNHPDTPPDHIEQFNYLKDYYST